MSFGMIPPSDASGQQHLALGILPEQLDGWRQSLHRHGIEIESAIDWPEGIFTVSTSGILIATASR